MALILYCTSEIINKIKKIRSSNSTKGDFGKILNIGGSQDYIGAPDLSVNAALSILRIGSDWVTVAAPSKVAWAINCLSPDIITKKIDCTYFNESHCNEILNFSNQFDVILVGPGLGNKKETLSFCKKILNSIQIPKIIDADAIKAIKLKDIKNSIITANKREMNILIENSNLKLSKIEDIQSFLGSNILLSKGHIDVIISSDKIMYNKTGNPGMTVGGTGDILAGMISGFVGQKNSLFDSACAGTFLCGKIGNQLFKKHGNGFLASDFIPEIANYS